MSRSLAATLSLRSAGCPFCEQVNPPAAKFCNACGAPMHLVPCARCGAVNDPKAATACYQCGATLPEDRRGESARSSSGAEASAAAGSSAWTAQDRTQPIEQSPPDGLDRDANLFATLQELQRLVASSDSGAGADRPAGNGRTAVAPLTGMRTYAASAIAEAEAIRPALQVTPRRRRAGMIGVGALAVLAAAGYYGYQSSTSAPALAATSPRGAEAKPIAPAAEVSPAAARSGTTPPDEAHPAATPARSSGETLTSPRRPAPEARAPAETVPAPAGPRPSTAGVTPGVIERQPPRVGPCTEAVAALGLCAPESVQRRE